MEPTTSKDTLPTFLIIGAAKCGTTSLHRYLELHPSIFMSAEKELKLFNHANWRDRLDWYRAQFQTDKPVRGESSPTYTMHPVMDSVPSRIHAVLPDARLIYLVREPVERLVAQYVEHVHLGIERRSLEQALADWGSPDNIFVMASRFAYQLERFREYFPDSQLLVVDQRDLFEDRLATLRRVFEFLDVDSDLELADFDVLHNVGVEKRRMNGAGHWLHEHGALRPLQARAQRLPKKARARLKNLITAPLAAPSLSQSLRRELEACLREDAARLRAYTGQDYAHWSV